jgi:hypothetical protein
VAGGEPVLAPVNEGQLSVLGGGFDLGQCGRITLAPDERGQIATVFNWGSWVVKPAFRPPVWCESSRR